MNLGQIQILKAADSGHRNVHRTVKQNETDRLGQGRRRFTGQQLSEANVPGNRDKECMIQREDGKAPAFLSTYPNQRTRQLWLGC